MDSSAGYPRVWSRHFAWWPFSFGGRRVFWQYYWARSGHDATEITLEAHHHCPVPSAELQRAEKKIRALEDHCRNFESLLAANYKLRNEKEILEKMVLERDGHLLRAAREIASLTRDNKLDAR